MNNRAPKLVNVSCLSVIVAREVWFCGGFLVPVRNAHDPNPRFRLNANQRKRKRLSGGILKQNICFVNCTKSFLPKRKPRMFWQGLHERNPRLQKQCWVCMSSFQHHQRVCEGYIGSIRLGNFQCTLQHTELKQRMVARQSSTPFWSESIGRKRKQSKNFFGKTVALFRDTAKQGWTLQTCKSEWQDVKSMCSVSDTQQRLSRKPDVTAGKVKAFVWQVDHLKIKDEVIAVVFCFGLFGGSQTLCIFVRMDFLYSLWTGMYFRSSFQCLWEMINLSLFSPNCSDLMLLWTRMQCCCAKCPSANLLKTALVRAAVCLFASSEKDFEAQQMYLRGVLRILIPTTRAWHTSVANPIQIDKGIFQESAKTLPLWSWS